MKSYKGWSASERQASLRKTKKAIAEGIIPKPEEVGCNRCGQKKGIIQYHNHDYSDPIKYLEALCWRCHLMIHSFHKNPQAVFDYFEEVWRGKQYPPIYYPNFDELRVHGIESNKKKSKKEQTIDKNLNSLLKQVRGR